MKKSIVAYLCEHGHVRLPEGSTKLISSTEGELQCSHVDTRQVDTAGREPSTGVLGERVAVNVLSRGARKVQLGVDDTEEERAARLLTLGTVELDGGSADRVITKVVRALVVAVFFNMV